jgi:hypothetical protein
MKIRAIAILGCLAVMGISACDSDSGPVDWTTAEIKVNEVVHKATGEGPDWIELYNPGSDPVDLAGWVIKDDNDTRGFIFPPGASIAARGFVVVEGVGGTSSYIMGFGLGKSDAARLFAPSGQLVDVTIWQEGDGPQGTSWGRHPDGTGDFATLPVPTPGQANAAPL